LHSNVPAVKVKTPVVATFPLNVRLNPARFRIILFGIVVLPFKKRVPSTVPEKVIAPVLVHVILGPILTVPLLAPKVHALDPAIVRVPAEGLDAVSAPNVAVAVLVTVYETPDGLELPSKIAVSEAPGADAPPEPPDAVDQLVVVVFHVPVPPLQYLSANFHSLTKYSI
jgi:hypothetical protein